MLQYLRNPYSRAQRRRRFNQTLTELQRYSDCELNELGISPLDIRRIAGEVARTAPK